MPPNAPTGRAVSYTHLDVYKRQFLYSSNVVGSSVIPALSNADLLTYRPSVFWPYGTACILPPVFPNSKKPSSYCEKSIMSFT